jgi:hypothetical protein
MSSRNKMTENILAVETEEPVVDTFTAAALQNFKTSVNAWSEAAANSLPRTAVITAQISASNKRIAASWALAGLLATSILTGGLYERHQRQEQARTAALKAAEQESATQQKTPQRLILTNKAPEQRVAATIVKRRRPTAVKNAAANDEELLATVDSDVSRQVPAAMEPLAQMMESSDGTN